MMNTFKQYALEQRKLELSETFLILNDNISPKLYQYVTDLGAIKFEDGHYHSYCGEVKLIVNDFIDYWTFIINKCITEADTRCNDIRKEPILEFIETTILTQIDKQNNFLDSFLPIESLKEEEDLNEIRTLLKTRLEELEKLKEVVISFDRPELVAEFLKRNLNVAIKKKNEVFTFAYKHIAEQLVKQTSRIRVSLEKILFRVRKNLQKLRKKHDERLRLLLHDLYNQNKERLHVSRQTYHRNTGIAEVENEIKKIRDKIENHVVEKPMETLEEEVPYWERRLAEFNEIDSTIQKLKTDLKNIDDYQKQFEIMSAIELPGPKQKCFDNLVENIKRRKEYLENRLPEAYLAMMTFFAVRGSNHIFYKDHIGTFYLDEYGHRVYVTHEDKLDYHIDCQGSSKKYRDSDQYYYDSNGRYIYDEKGVKVYQCGPCTSCYKLSEDELLKKITVDCGHSEIPNPKCKMQQKNPNDILLLPKVDSVDIKKTLAPEVAKYIWESVAYVLPDALRDTGQKRSNNPIYYLAHRLLYHKYFNNTLTSLRARRADADKYRASVMKKRKDDAVAASKAWIAKQVKPRKPEESDDTDLRAVFDYRAQQEFINQLTYYDYN